MKYYSECPDIDTNAEYLGKALSRSTFNPLGIKDMRINEKISIKRKNRLKNQLYHCMELVRA